MYFTTSIVLVAGATLAFATLYLLLALQRPRDRTRNLLFALFASSYAGSILMARAAYMAETPAQFFSAMRVSWVIGSFGLSFLIWYVAFYTGVRPRRFLWGLTGLFATIGLVAIFASELLFDPSTGVASRTLPWGETILALNVEDAPLAGLVVLATLATIGYLILADVRQFRRGDHSDGRALAIGIGWFVATIVAENLAILGVIDFVVLNDFGFLGFVLAMSLQEAESRVMTEQLLLDYRANLEQMVEARTNELRIAQVELLSQAEIRATAEERTRLANELHDAVTQVLFSINLIAGSLPQLMRNDAELAQRTIGELQRLTRGALAEMRTLLRELRPHTIAVTDLATLLHQLTDGLAARHDLQTNVRVDLDDALPPDVHMAVYRITQEALNNVGKHANASHLSVELVGDDRRVHLSVTDDGYGFDTTSVAPHRMGLDIMQERASGIGAELAVASKPNSGTTIDVEWGGNSHG